MEINELNYAATRIIPGRACVGVVDSGDLEALIELFQIGKSTVRIRTSMDGFGAAWRAVLDRFFSSYDGAARIQINDAGAPPPVWSICVWPRLCRLARNERLHSHPGVPRAAQLY